MTHHIEIFPPVAMASSTTIVVEKNKMGMIANGPR
jgi:hypothetical protein